MYLGRFDQEFCCNSYGVDYGGLQDTRGENHRKQQHCYGIAKVVWVDVGEATGRIQSTRTPEHEADIAGDYK